MRSAYFLENPQYVFADPPLAKDDVIGFMNRERKFAPILLSIVNEQFFPIAQLSIADKKCVFRRFANGFNEIFCYWVTAKSYPVTSNVFVSHYGYYMDCDDLEGFFEGTGPTADAHHKLSIPIMTQSVKMKRKFYELDVDETELAALTGLWMFAALEHADLWRNELSLQRDAVIDELHRYLTYKVGTTGVGVRIGRLLLYLQSLTELMTTFSDYVVMGRIFLPDGHTEIWDMWDEHAAELPQSISSQAPATHE
ncbi:hypothetical protein AAVH_38224 [Aphelenchoides avenae]|nr:hypothetical protein AAVH_38224 [Aphelenchus avenae]